MSTVGIISFGARRLGENIPQQIFHLVTNIVRAPSDLNSMCGRSTIQFIAIEGTGGLPREVRACATVGCNAPWKSPRGLMYVQIGTHRAFLPPRGAVTSAFQKRDRIAEVL